jgi:hypothetical protein
MPYFTLLMELKQWDLSGLTGHSRWSGSVVNFCVASKADAIHLQTLILTLQQSRNLIKSKTDTMPTTNWRCSLKRKGTLESLRLKNVSIPNYMLRLSPLKNMINRSHVSTVLSTPKKSHHSGGPSLENHQHISYSLQHNMYGHQMPFLSSRHRSLGEILSTWRRRHHESCGSLPFRRRGQT